MTLEAKNGYNAEVRQFAMPMPWSLSTSFMKFGLGFEIMPSLRSENTAESRNHRKPTRLDRCVRFCILCPWTFWSQKGTGKTKIFPETLALLIESAWIPQRGQAALDLLRSWLQGGRAPFLVKQFASYFALWQKEMLQVPRRISEMQERQDARDPQVDDIIWEHVQELILAASGPHWQEQCLHGKAVEIILEHCAVLQPELRREAFAELLLRVGSVGADASVACAVALARGEFTAQAQVMKRCFAVFWSRFPFEVFAAMAGLVHRVLKLDDQSTSEALLDGVPAGVQENAHAEDMVHLILCLLVFWTIARDKASEGESVEQAQEGLKALAGQDMQAPGLLEILAGLWLRFLPGNSEWIQDVGGNRFRNPAFGIDSHNAMEQQERQEQQEEQQETDAPAEEDISSFRCDAKGCPRFWTVSRKSAKNPATAYSNSFFMLLHGLIHVLILCPVLVLCSNVQARRHSGVAKKSHPPEEAEEGRNVEVSPSVPSMTACFEVMTIRKRIREARKARETADAGNSSGRPMPRKVERFHKDLIRKEVWRQKFNYLFKKMQAGVDMELVHDRKNRRHGDHMHGCYPFSNNEVVRRRTLKPGVLGSGTALATRAE
eukprot:s1508_g34.t3